jgi:hypothetical protein
MQQNHPFKPDELFRYYRRGMLDQDTLMTQVLLNLIELYETQQALASLLDMASETLSDLALDMDTVFQLLRLSRPSQAGHSETGPVDQNGVGGSDEGSADDPDATDESDPDQDDES